MPISGRLKRATAFVEGILTAVRGELGEVCQLIAVLLTLFSAALPWNLLPAVLSTVAIALLCHRTVRLVRAESPEEQARAQKVLAGCVVAGLLMAVAKPLAYWATGITYDETTKKWYIGGKAADLPAELITMLDRVLTLLMVLGVVTVIGGVVYGGIQLARRAERKLQG